MSYCDNCENYNPETCSALVRSLCGQGESCGSYQPIGTYQAEMAAMYRDEMRRDAFYPYA